MDGLNAPRPTPPAGFGYEQDSPAPSPTATLTRPPMPAAPAVANRPAAPAGFSYDAPEPAPEKASVSNDSYGFLDVPKAIIGGAVRGVGTTIRGLGEATDTLSPAALTRGTLEKANAPRWLSRPGTAIGDLVGSPIERAGEWIKGTESDKAQAVQEKPLVEGELMDPKTWRFGEGASSPMNWALKGGDLVGNLAPMVIGSEATAARALSRAPGVAGDVLTAIKAGKVAELAPEAQQVAKAALTRSGRAAVATGAGVGGVQGAEDAAQGESERIRQMPDADLEKLPGYSTLIARGMKPEDARATLADQVRSRVFATTLPVATATGAITTAPLLSEAQGTLARVVGQSALRRAGAGAALEAPVQGGIAVGQTAAQVAAANSATGEQRDPLQDSLATFGAGALPGAAFGGLGGLHRPVPGSLTEAAALTRTTKPDVDRSPAPREVAPLMDSMTAAPPPAAQTRPQAPAQDAGARPVDPIPPPWLNPETGELGTPTRDDVLSAVAQQMRAQYDVDGKMRVNTQALADAWNVPVEDVKRVRTKASRLASDLIAQSERAPQAADTAPEPVASDATATREVAGPSFDDIQQDIDRTFNGAQDRLAEALPAEAPVQPAAPPAAEVQARAEDAAVGGAKPSHSGADGAAPEPNGSDSVSKPPQAVSTPEVGVSTEGVTTSTDDASASSAPSPEATSAGQDGEPVELAPESATTAAATEAQPIAADASNIATKATDPSEQRDSAGVRAFIPEPSAAAKRADRLRVKTPEGEMNAKRFVDARVAAGFDRVESQRMGDKMQHRLVNAAGEKVPVPPGVLPYAQEAVVARRAAPAEARPDVARDPASAPSDAKPAKPQGAQPTPKTMAAEPAHPVDVAAAEAATSPHNDLPEPTPAQKEAGNYQKGHVRIHGLDVSIENPRGSTRSGVGKDGATWSHQMSDHYGYVRGTVGADGDHVDVYVGPKPQARRVFVVDQVHQDTGKFDEHKAMMGFASKRDAIAAYRSNFDKGWKVGPVRDFTIDQFKTWLKNGDTKKPAVDAAVTPAVDEGRKTALSVPLAAKAAAGTSRRGGIATNGARVRLAGGKLEYVPGARETLEAYFKPGEIRPAYAGKQKIDAFHWNDGRWSVDVHSVRDDGSEYPKGHSDGAGRTHATLPTNRDLRSVLGKPEVATKAENGKTAAVVRDFSFAGESARTADLTALDRARDREREGFGSEPDEWGNRVGSPEDTHAETGWHRGADGKWRFEIDDSEATVKGGNWLTAARSPEGARLADVLSHKDLFDAYPALAGVKVRVEERLGQGGAYSDAANTIAIGDPAGYAETGRRSLTSTLLHEIQHAIQRQEGFARGGSSREFEAPLRRQRDELVARRDQIAADLRDARAAGDAERVTRLEADRRRVDERLSDARLESDASVRTAASKEYRNLAGEVEARNTQTRLDMDARERRSVPPTETEDVRRRDQTVRFAGESPRTARFEGEAPSAAELEHAQRVTAMARDVTKAWKGDDVPRVEVVPTPEQLPRAAKIDPVTGRPDPSFKRARGLYDGRTVWLVASAHPDTAEGRGRIARTLAHEAVGHYGVDRIVHRELGPDAWKSIEGSIARLEKEGAGGKAMQDILADVRRRYGDVDATTLARETLAVMAERGVRNGLLDRVVAAVREFLRRVMPDLKLAPAELRQLLARSNEYLERGEAYSERVERQAAMAFSRDGWSDDFPDVVLGHKLGTVRDHPDYAAAKAGDDAAALRLARDTVTKDFADRVKAAIPEGSEPTIVPVVAREATGNNRIPDMAAEVLAQRLGLEVDHGMVQAEKIGRGGGDAMHRLANQPTFEGKVTRGKDYVLLDDTLTQGGTLAQLKTHIEREGGNVVLATALTGKDYSRKLALDPTTLGNVRDRFGRIEGWWRREFGHGFDGLTESEARTILTYDGGRLSPDALRDRVIARRIPGLGEVGKGAAGDRPGTQAPGAGGREDAGVGEAPPKPRRDFSLNDRGEEDEPGKPRKPFSKASASIEAMNAVMPKLDDSAFDKAKDWVKGKLLDLEPKLLGALQLRHVLELARDQKVLAKHASFYADTFQRMDADRNAMTMEGAAKVERLNKWAFERGPAGWAGKLTEEAKGLFKFMHEVTQITVDPTGDYERLLMRDSRGEQTPWTEELRKERIKTLQEQQRGRSGDDKTKILDQIKDLRKLPAREKARALKYPELVAKWNALSPQAKEMFVMMRDHYRETSERLEEATLARIESLDIPEQNKRAAAEMVRTNFADNKVGGVYFPLARFGDFWIASRLGGENGEGGEYHFTKYETAFEAQRAEKRLRAAGHTIEATGRQNKDYETQKPVTGTFMGQLTGMLRQGGAPDKVLDDIHQMFLRTLPELSLRKSGIHRSNIAGYTDDVPRIFASNVLHGAHQIARARYGYQLEDSVEHMKGTVEGHRSDMGTVQAAHADALVGEIAKRHQWIMNPTNSQLATMLNAVGFTYYLSASPASALVNLSQGAMVTLPVLGARHGWPAAMREMGAATRDAMRSFGNIRRTLATDEERRAFDTLERNGTFARTATHSLGGIAEGDALKMNPAYAKVMTAMGYMFQKAEVINREAAGIAAFRLATKDGKSFNEAIKYADEIVNGTHFDYSNANRARIMQGNVQKVLFQFKNYALGMSWVLYRNLEQSLRGETPEVRRVARRTLTGVLGMTTLFAGIMGSPINNLLAAGANAYHAVTGDDDEPWDFNTEFRAWLGEHLGTTAASVIADGVVDRLGANISNRVGTGDLWFRDADRQLEGVDAYHQALESLAGPIGGLAKNMFVGSQQISEGHTERGIETLMPTAIKNAMKSVRFAHEGVNTLRGDPIVNDVTGAEQLIQALGFQPTRLAEQQRVNSALMNYQRAVQDRRQSLMNAFAMATSSGDRDDRTAALTKIQAFNRKYPEIAIGMPNLQASLRRRSQQSAQAENGILLNRKLAPRIRGEVGGLSQN